MISKDLHAGLFDVVNSLDILVQIFQKLGPEGPNFGDEMSGPQNAWGVSFDGMKHRMQARQDASSKTQERPVDITDEDESGEPQVS